MPQRDTRLCVRSRRTRTIVGLAFVTMLFGGVLASCSSVPQAVLNVPGNYVIDLWVPTPDYPNGRPSATVLMCLDEASAVFLETGDGSWGGVGIIRLTWVGVE